MSPPVVPRDLSDQPVLLPPSFYFLNLSRISRQQDDVPGVSELDLMDDADVFSDLTSGWSEKPPLLNREGPMTITPTAITRLSKPPTAPSPIGGPAAKKGVVCACKKSKCLKLYCEW